LSIVGEDGVTAPATSVGFTVAVSLDEHCEIGEYDESVTLYEYAVVEVGEAA
jgi:hypothetical protein